MSEYWKSTPKYWCKHCSVYVRDTKFERTNHEATAKHQNSLKRFLRDLHRGHENEQRDKDRAKREIERLNGVVGSSSSAPATTSSSSTAAGRPASQTTSGTTEVQRQKQWEQLAEMGIDVPTELRGDMAMAGEWTVTTTKVIDDTPMMDENGNMKAETMATGVRKRVKREGEDDEEEALKGLFKKPKQWGRDTKQAPEDDTDLDALLSGTLVPPSATAKEKAEDTSEASTKKEEGSPLLKSEPIEDDNGITEPVKPELISGESASIKIEETVKDDGEMPAVLFKKRKPKNIRNK